MMTPETPERCISTTHMGGLIPGRGETHAVAWVIGKSREDPTNNLVVRDGGSDVVVVPG
jgi:hypothetical protein